jgi:hypothetical protein
MIKKKKLDNLIKIIFTSITILFLIIILSIFMSVRIIMQNFPIIILIITILSTILIILTKKSKLSKKQKKYLILTAIGIIGFSTFSILHNLFYALLTLITNNLILSFIIESLEVLSFIISIFVFPIIFLIGIIGSIKYYIK